jgi:hypothetical protein
MKRFRQCVNHYHSYIDGVEVIALEAASGTANNRNVNCQDAFIEFELRDAAERSRSTVALGYYPGNAYRCQVWGRQ